MSAARVVASGHGGPRMSTGESLDAMWPARTVAWDGLRLEVPPDWEPARLGLGYLVLEDASGPRLTLRWQRLKKTREPERILKRLARRKLLRPDFRPGGAVAAWLKAFPPEYQARACADAAGRGADSVLFVIPGDGLAVLAAPHARPNETSGSARMMADSSSTLSDDASEGASPWVLAARTIAAAPAGDFSLYDVQGQAPAGFRLTAFTVQLGHFHFQYQSTGGTLDFYRFAPSEVILRGSSLEGWAGGVFAKTLGKVRRFEPGYFQDCPAARFGESGAIGRAHFARALAARVFASARFPLAMAWRPDGAKILAAVARHRGDLSREAFEEVCRRYVVQAP